MVIAVVAVLLVVWIAIGAALALMIGRAAHIGDVKHQDEVFLRRVTAEERMPVRV